MSLKTESTKIGDCTYSCTQLNAKDSVRLQAKIAKFVGNSMSNINEFSLDNLDAKAMSGLLKSLDDDEFFDGIYMRLINTCRRVDSKGNGDFVDFNNDFAGKLMDAHKVFLFALKVNYEDFIVAVASVFGGDGKKVKKMLEKAMTSIT